LLAIKRPGFRIGQRLKDEGVDDVDARDDPSVWQSVIVETTIGDGSVANF